MRLWTGFWVLCFLLTYSASGYALSVRSGKMLETNAPAKAISESEVFKVEKPAGAKTIIPRHCVSEMLGVEFGCNPDWKLTRNGKKFAITISEHPRVTVVVEESEQKLRFLSELTREALASYGRYADNFTVNRMTICQREGVEVTGNLHSDPTAVVHDYYILDHHQLHLVEFTAASQDAWNQYQQVIADFVISLNIREISL